MKRNVVIQSIITVTLFFIINFGLWEVLVSNGLNESWASFTVYLVLIIVVILIWHKKLLSEWNRFKCETKSWKKFFAELFIWLIAAIVLAYVFQYLVSKGFKTQNTETVAAMVDTIPPILSCIMMSVFTPIIEELTFRQSIIGFIRKEDKRLILVMMIISIIVFDCIHLYRWQDFFYYLPIAIALTAFYVKHNRNIYSSIMMHSIANLPGAIMMMIGVM